MQGCLGNNREMVFNSLKWSFGYYFQIGYGSGWQPEIFLLWFSWGWCVGSDRPGGDIVLYSGEEILNIGFES